MAYTVNSVIADIPLADGYVTLSETVLVPAGWVATQLPIGDGFNNRDTPKALLTNGSGKTISIRDNGSFNDFYNQLRVQKDFIRGKAGQATTGGKPTEIKATFGDKIMTVGPSTLRMGWTVNVSPETGRPVVTGTVQDKVDVTGQGVGVTVILTLEYRRGYGLGLDVENQRPGAMRQFLAGLATVGAISLTGPVRLWVGDQVYEWLPAFAAGAA